MKSPEFVLAILSSLPLREVEGKKRFQKIAYLLKDSGTACGATFHLRNFGPFSVELARATEFLSEFGVIEREERPIGIHGAFVTIYSLPDEENDDDDDETLDADSVRILNCINNFSTIELEIAATVRYFESLGHDRRLAEEETKKMKPTKAIPKIIVKSREILNCLG